MKIKIQHSIYAFILAFVSLSMNSNAQYTNTSYFMEDVTERYNLNPAFTPQSKYYFDFIILPNLYINAGNNDFTISDFLYNQNGITNSFLNSKASKDKFFNSIRPSSKINFDFNLNILSFGFRVKQKHYITIDLGMSMNTNVALPRDLFKLGLYGTPDKINVNSYDLSLLGADMMLYSSVGVGYSYKINEKWTVGAKAKFLMGYAGMQTNIEKLQLDASMENWTLSSMGSVHASLPIDYTTTDGKLNAESIMLQSTGQIIELLYKPAGLGASFDIGATYEPIKNLTISAAFTDLGFIRWSGNMLNGKIEGTHTFDGVDIDLENQDNISNQFMDKFEQLGEEFVNSIVITDPSPYTQMMYANFIFGAEYGIIDNKISFGAMSRTRFNSRYTSEEVTLAANFRPANWFKGTVSYSFIDGRWGTLGLGLNLNLGPLTTYIIADYIPISWANVKSTENNIDMPLPYKTQRFNIQAGFSWNIYRDAKDKDDDGVYGRHDDCPNTDMDLLRKACNTDDTNKIVDKHGCGFDTDKDSVHDCLDKCPNTPLGVPVDSLGCPFDTDKDGIEDYMDKCPNTPSVAKVDNKGCPIDSDNDGVADYLDKCPETPANIEVDDKGCPFDTDNDGIPNYLDKCPNTPTIAKIDSKGCPIDSDMDRVPDYLDKCPETPINIEVNEHGCPVDSDNDGVNDDVDKCPFKAGPASNQGCPELTKEVVNVFKKALNGIQFQSGRDIIKPSSYPILDQIVAIMGLNNDYNLVIKGHTDNSGADESNLQLSKDRAASVEKYLIENGIDSTRLTSEGYGESIPVADNKTSKGRAKNRRVEFEVNYTQTTIERIENPELKNEETE